MEANLLQLREKYFETKSELEKESAFLGDLKKRISATAIRLNSMVRELEEMTQVRNVILKQISRNEATEADLKEQTLKIDDLKLSQKNVDDLLTVLKTTEIETQIKVTKLGEAFRGAGHSLWYAVSQHEAARIGELDASPILKAWGAYLLSGAPGNFGFFLESRFNGFKIDLTKITSDLQKEYLAPAILKKGGDR